jgi:predicted Zn-dependent protease
VTDAALASAQALQIQGFLDYSREFEREADRAGLAMLDKAGFDVRGMSSFFERLQRQSRFNDPGDRRLPGYLRTHPLTSERIADMQSRVEAFRTGRAGPSLSADSTDYALIKAKLKSQQGTPSEAVEHFRTLIADKGVFRSRADGYGYALALTRARDFAKATDEVKRVRAQGETHPMLDLAEADLLIAQGNVQAGIKLLTDARKRYADRRALQYRLAESYLNDNQPKLALDVVAERIAIVQDDVRLWELQARAANALGKKGLAHRSQAEAYFRRGFMPQAIDQLELALKVKDEDQQELSVAAARMRDMRRDFEEQKKKQGPGTRG